MFRSKFLGLAGFALVSCQFASVAVADTVYADWVNISPKENVTIRVNEFHGYNFSGTVQTGVNNWTVKNDSGVNTTTSDFFIDKRTNNEGFKAFCIEIMQYLDDPTLFTVESLDVAPDPDYPTTDLIEGMGSPKADRIRELWFRFFDHIGTSATNGAAFQLAVWNIVYDSDNSVSNNQGTFYVTSNHTSAINQANTWLASLTGDSEFFASLTALTNPLGQDMVTQFPPPPTTDQEPPVPTPMAAGMGLIGFAIIGLRRQRPAKA